MHVINLISSVLDRVNTIFRDGIFNYQLKSRQKSYTILMSYYDGLSQSQQTFKQSLNPAIRELLKFVSYSSLHVKAEGSWALFTHRSYLVSILS